MQPPGRPDRPAPAGDGKDAPVHGKEKDGYDGDPEPWHGYPEEGKKREKLVDPGVDPGGRNDADGHGDDQGHHDGKDHHLQGGGKPFGDEVQNFLVPLERAPQISPHRVAEPVEIPHVVRLVQAEFGANFGDRLFIGAEAQHDPHRVARAEVDQGRDQDGDEEEDRDEDQQSTKDVLEQERRPSMNNFIHPE